jgi:hypothetical protein
MDMTGGTGGPDGRYNPRVSTREGSHKSAEGAKGTIPDLLIGAGFKDSNTPITPRDDGRLQGWRVWDGAWVTQNNIKSYSP